MTIKKLLEEIIRQELFFLKEEVDGTMKFWHGGDLSSSSLDNSYEFSQKKGRYEYGPGLYLTTHYDTAKKYAKGSRKLYVVTVAPGVDLRKSFIDMSSIEDFVNQYVKPKLKQEILDALETRSENGKIRASVFSNYVLNLNAITPSKTGALRQFFIDKGIDYEVVSNAFGWGEKMLVLFNMNKIIDTKQIGPKDEENYKDF